MNNTIETKQIARDAKRDLLTKLESEYDQFVELGLCEWIKDQRSIINAEEKEDAL